jgi:hypothetical protein
MIQEYRMSINPRNESQKRIRPQVRKNIAASKPCCFPRYFLTQAYMENAYPSKNKVVGNLIINSSFRPVREKKAVRIQLKRGGLFR